MTQPLFVNYNPQFISRIRTEAGPHALVTPSMIQALRWITNPEVAISGVYLNPNDLTYSALRFLEILVLQRPATPVFLIDDENEMTHKTQEEFFTNSTVRGTFKGSESFLEFMAPLRTETPTSLQSIKKRISGRSAHAGHLAIPLIDFIHTKKFLHDVFIEDEAKELRLFAAAGTEIDPDYLSHASEKTSWLFINEKAVQEMREKLQQTRSSYINLDHFPLSWKTAETLYNAKVLLNELRKGGVSDGMVENTHYLLSDVFQLVSQFSNTSNLSKLVSQAKQCDRTIACATLSILMCKSLKFEKNAIVEILGLASIFQDISLYNSPFGNLAESNPKGFSPEAMNYFVHHSCLSADLVAQNTSIPDVTLQVMRQHHERKDRTGFPNRVGGMQLHPMAEILSLINAYLDRDENGSAEAEIFTHYSDRVVNTFKEILASLEHQKANASSGSTAKAA